MVGMCVYVVFIGVRMAWIGLQNVPFFFAKRYILSANMAHLDCC